MKKIDTFADPRCLWWYLKMGDCQGRAKQQPIDPRHLDTLCLIAIVAGIGHAGEDKHQLSPMKII